MDGHGTTLATEAAPGAPDNQISFQRKALRLVRGAMEGFGLVAVVVAIGAGYALTREPSEAEAAQQQFTALADSVCPRDEAGIKGPDGEPDFIRGAAYYDCLTQKLVALQQPRNPVR